MANKALLEYVWRNLVGVPVAVTTRDGGVVRGLFTARLPDGSVALQLVRTTGCGGGEGCAVNATHHTTARHSPAPLPRRIR